MVIDPDLTAQRRARFEYAASIAQKWLQFPRSIGYKVYIYSPGKSEELVHAYSHSRYTVGSIAVGHGHCGGPENKAWIRTANTEELRRDYLVGAIRPPGTRFPNFTFAELKGKRVQEKYFIEAYFGHCYTWGGEKGPILTCRNMYADALHTTPAKIRIGKTDAIGGGNWEQLWLDVYNWDEQFDFCCRGWLFNWR